MEKGWISCCELNLNSSVHFSFLRQNNADSCNEWAGKCYLKRKMTKQCRFMQFRFRHSLAPNDFFMSQARLAQSVEHQTFNLRVAGSSPSSGDENFQKQKFLKSGSCWKIWRFLVVGTTMWRLGTFIAEFSDEKREKQREILFFFCSPCTMENFCPTIAPVAQSVSASYL